MNNSVKRVEPNPFGRIGLGAMSKKEHNSIGDWALRQKRRRQLNDLQRCAYTGIPTQVTGVYDDKNQVLLSVVSFERRTGQILEKI